MCKDAGSCRKSSVIWWGERRSLTPPRGKLPPRPPTSLGSFGLLSTRPGVRDQHDSRSLEGMGAGDIFFLFIYMKNNFTKRELSSWVA